MLQEQVLLPDPADLRQEQPQLRRPLRGAQPAEAVLAGVAGGPEVLVQGEGEGDQVHEGRGGQAGGLVDQLRHGPVRLSGHATCQDDWNYESTHCN